MKIITLDTLKTFLDELNKKYGMEFYTKTEVDRKLKGLSGTTGYTQSQVDALLKELESRVPHYQYKITIKQKPHQTITASANGKTYTETFLAERGTSIAFTVKADQGYIAGTLSHQSFKATQDITVTAADATVPEILKPGEKRLYNGETAFLVPPKVSVLKFLFNDRKGVEKSAYVKVTPGAQLHLDAKVNDSAEWGYNGEISYSYQIYFLKISTPYAYEPFKIDKIYGATDDNFITMSWSKEINEHPWDYDISG